MISSKDLHHNITEAKLSDETSTTPSGAISREPSPNRGGTVPDSEAIGADSEDKREWLRKRGIDVEKQVKIKKLNHMRYQHEDLSLITMFLRDFGMRLVKKTERERWFAGYGPEAYVYYARQGPKKYLGGSFEVQSYSDLERALTVEGAKVLSDGIEEMTDAPGGGHIVTIEDPEGFPVNFVFGQDKSVGEDERKKIREGKGKIVWNDEVEKPRERAFQRFEPGPAGVFKLGHFGINVANFDSTMDWYTRNFNLIPSDILYVPLPPSPSSSSDPSSRQQQQPPPQRKQVAIFLHVNLNEGLTDHHTMFITSLPPSSEEDDPSHTNTSNNNGHENNNIPQPHVHHASFETHDLDTQFLGHQYLLARSSAFSSSAFSSTAKTTTTTTSTGKEPSKNRYKPVWGVGRHILGSQIFDYWWDTSGFMIEHYCDGDLVNLDTKLAHGPAGHEGLAVWGPSVPKEFLD